MRRQEILGAVLAAAFFAAPCAVAVQTAGIEWTLGRNATREGDIVVIDTQGKRNGGAAHAKLDLGGLTGGVRATIRARGRGIGRPDKSYFGLKFMFHYRDPASGAEKWPQADHKGGDFDWTTLELTTDLGPTSVGEVGVTLGLQNVAGKVEFDVSSFTVAPHELYEFPRYNQDYVISYPDTKDSRAEAQGRGDGKFVANSETPRLRERKQLRRWTRRKTTSRRWPNGAGRLGATRCRATSRRSTRTSTSTNTRSGLTVGSIFSRRFSSGHGNTE